MKDSITVLDDNLEDFIFNLKESNEVESIPYSVACKCMNVMKKDRVNIVKLSGQSREIKIFGEANEGVVIPDSGYKKVSSDIYVIDEENNEAWFSDSNPDIDTFPILRVTSSNSRSVYEYYFNKSFLNSEKTIEYKKDVNIDRLEEDINITNLELVNSPIPYEFYAITEKDKKLYIRYRSGSLKIKRSDTIKDIHSSETIFKAFIGDNHPGLFLYENEVLNIITSVDYINILSKDDLPRNMVDKLYEETFEKLDDINDFN